MTYIGEVEQIPELYEPETVKQLMDKGYSISIQEQKTRWFEESLWTVFVSLEGAVMPSQPNLNHECLNAVLDSIERLAGCT